MVCVCVFSVVLLSLIIINLPNRGSTSKYFQPPNESAEIGVGILALDQTPDSFQHGRRVEGTCGLRRVMYFEVRLSVKVGRHNVGFAIWERGGEDDEVARKVLPITDTDDVANLDLKGEEEHVE